MMIKNAFKWFNRNICIQNKQRSYMEEKNKRDNIIGQYNNVQLWWYYERRHKRT